MVDAATNASPLSPGVRDVERAEQAACRVSRRPRQRDQNPIRKVRRAHTSETPVIATKNLLPATALLAYSVVANPGNALFAPGKHVLAERDSPLCNQVLTGPDGAIHRRGRELGGRLPQHEGKCREHKGKTRDSSSTAGKDVSASTVRGATAYFSTIRIFPSVQPERSSLAAVQTRVFLLET